MKTQYLRAELNILTEKINSIINDYKYNSDDWEYVGALQAYDANNALKKISKTTRSYLKIIIQDYDCFLTKKDAAKVNDYLKKCGKRVTTEFGPDAVTIDQAIRVDKYNSIHTETPGEALESYKTALKSFENSLSIQGARFENKVNRICSARNVRRLSIWVPIAISILSLLLSIVNLFLKGAQNA